MPINLDNDILINEAVTTVKIKDFTVDFSNSLLFVTYQNLNNQGGVVSEGFIELDSVGLAEVVTQAGVLANTDVFEPIKASLYSRLVQELQVTGNVT